MMNSLHVKSLDYLFSQYFANQEFKFSHDSDLKRVNPLIQRKMAYTTVHFSRPCSVFFEMAKSGTDAGFNTLVAWGGSAAEVLEVVRLNEIAGEAIRANQCVMMQKIWDPEYKDRSTCFGWQRIRTKRISTRLMIKNKGILNPPKDGKAEMAEVTPAFNRFVIDFETYTIPFFKSLDEHIGKKWTDVAAHSAPNTTVISAQPENGMD